MLVNCLPLLYLKQQIQGITQWKWIYITIPELTPSAIFHAHEKKVIPHFLCDSLSIIDVRQLEIDLFLLRSPLFSRGARLTETKPPSFLPPAG